MDRKLLIEQIRAKKSFLCVGLDSDPAKLPAHLQTASNPVLEFNKQIIDATAKYAVAFKPNMAFYEVDGANGLETLRATIEYAKSHYPDILIVLDAKRGDIGNTSKMYAKSCFEHMQADVVTVAPYMGHDSVSPFLDFPGKGVALLALTSNPGSLDFQHAVVDPKTGERLFEKVIKTALTWEGSERLMFVAGATQASLFGDIRAIAPESFLLVPGVGTQGGSLSEVCKHGMTKECGLLVNSSRGIIFADQSEKFAEVAAQQSAELQAEMEQELKAHNVI